MRSARSGAALVVLAGAAFLGCASSESGNTQFRANILGADLGIPVQFADTLYIFFGDTIGFAGIWGFGESHPDSVGYRLQDKLTRSAAHLPKSKLHIARDKRAVAFSRGHHSCQYRKVAGDPLTWS